MLLCTICDASVNSRLTTDSRYPDALMQGLQSYYVFALGQSVETTKQEVPDAVGGLIT